MSFFQYERARVKNNRDLSHDFAPRYISCVKIGRSAPFFRVAHSSIRERRCPSSDSRTKAILVVSDTPEVVHVVGRSSNFSRDQDFKNRDQKIALASVVLLPGVEGKSPDIPPNPPYSE